MPPKGKGRKQSQSGKTRATPVSASKRANLIFPVGRFRTMLRKARIGTRLSADAGIVAASVCQFIISELCQISVDVMESKQMKTVGPSHIQKAILGDPEFAKLLANVQISGGGRLPNILKELMPKKKEKKVKEE